MVDMTPVDYVSSAIVHLSRQKESLGKAFHLVNPHSLHLSKLVNEINALGYPLKQMRMTSGKQSCSMLIFLKKCFESSIISVY